MKKIIILMLIFCVNMNSNTKFGANKLNFIKCTKKHLSNNIPYSNLTVDNVLENLEDEDVHFLMFSFVDILGRLKEIIVPIGKAKSIFKDGLTFDSSSVPGYLEIENSDMIIKPDLSTLRLLPWTDGIHKTAWFMCDVYKESDIPYEFDSRYILKKVLYELEELNCKFNTGVELEFFLFSKLKNELKPIDEKGYMDAQTGYSRQQEDHILVHALNSIGIDVEKLHHEVAPGQYEISINYADALKVADQIIAMKYVIRVIANQLDYEVNFMPKPLYGYNGSAMHVHYSLYNILDKQNDFYSIDNEYHMSTIAQKFLAGNIKYISDFSAVLNPTINSYKRLVKGFEAPVYRFWGIKNRSALFRIPLLHQNAQESMRIEIRSPDPSANPYLVFAAILKTGLQGLKNDLILPDPINVNIFKLPKDKRKELNLMTLPKNLTQALKLLKQSDLAKELFTDSGLDLYVKIKQKEVNNFNQSVTNLELKL